MFHLPLTCSPFFPSPTRPSCCSHCSSKTSRPPIRGIRPTSLLRTGPTRWCSSSSSQSCSVSAIAKWSSPPATILPCPTSSALDRTRISASSRPLLPPLAPVRVHRRLKIDEVSLGGMLVVSQHVPLQVQKVQPFGKVCPWVSRPPQQMSPQMSQSGGALSKLSVPPTWFSQSCPLPCKI